MPLTEQTATFFLFFLEAVVSEILRPAAIRAWGLGTNCQLNDGVFGGCVAGGFSPHSVSRFLGFKDL